MTINNSVQELSIPSPAMRNLDRLVGTWEISGPSINGQVEYEWMEGCYFLCQKFDLIHDGRVVKGIEIIGHSREFGSEKPGNDINSHVFDTVGNTLNYVYELEDNVLTIWGGAKNSPAYYKGTFSTEGDTVRGEWVWPGGGYQSNMTKLK
ncbi:MAG: hypothetical protein R3E39_24645 [Anaerolineae bacterium]